MDAVLTPATKVEIIPHLYGVLARRQMSLTEVTWIQHQFHERRRWSAVEMLQAVDASRLTELDRVCLWNAGRAELTTKPGADRLARQADAECRRWLETDPALASVMQACGTWSRYWNEEEAHHEIVFNTLAERLGMEPVSDETYIEYRKIFPDDGMLRTLFLLAISEITATVNYSRCAALTADPGLRALFKQVAADEAQHMRYFIAFAKALVDSGRYPAKDAFVIAHLFVREGGELYGSCRSQLEQRDTHVNWWDTIDTGALERPEDLQGKLAMIFSALRNVTGLGVSSAAEVEDVWMDLVEA
jgi:hypothetical protein